MNTTIAISKQTREILLEYGKKSETYDDVIQRMYNTIQLQKELEQFVNETNYSTLKEAKEWTELKLQAND